MSEIRNRCTNKIMFKDDKLSLKELVEKHKADLSYSDLSYSDLSNSNLFRANLYCDTIQFM